MDDDRAQNADVLDVKSVVDSLERIQEHAHIGKLLKSALVAQSCRSDIILATEMCSTLRHFLTVGGDSNISRRATSETALIMAAVLLYVRATDDDTKRGGRGSLNIKSKLSPSAKDAHSRLVKLRHASLAHVKDQQEPEEYKWRETFIFGRQFSTGWNFGVTTRQTTKSDSVLRDIELCLKEAAPIIEERTLKRINDLTIAFNAVPADLLDRHIVNVGQFIPDAQIADKLLNS